MKALFDDTTMAPWRGTETGAVVLNELEIRHPQPDEMQRVAILLNDEHLLPFSNWEWAVRAQSESTLSLRAGLKATLGRLGRVPLELLSDHSSTVAHQLKRGAKERGFRE